MDLEGEQSPVAIMENMKCRLDGLWALICAKCMGLWRTNNSNSNSDSQVEQHPFFSGLNLTNNAIEDGTTGLGRKLVNLS